MKCGMFAQGMLAAVLVVGAGLPAISMAQEVPAPQTTTQDAVSPSATPDGGLAAAKTLQGQSLQTTPVAPAPVVVQPSALAQFPTTYFPMGTSHWTASERIVGSGAFPVHYTERVPADVVRTDTSLVITPRGGTPMSFVTDTQDPTMMDLAYGTQTYVEAPASTATAAAAPTTDSVQARLQQADPSGSMVDKGTLRFARLPAADGSTQAIMISGLPSIPGPTGAAHGLEGITLTPMD